MLLPFQGLYESRKIVPTVKGLAAGGANSYFMVDAEDTEKGRVNADLFSCGAGIFGNLGNGRWTHVQGSPTKIKALSGLFECMTPSDPQHIKVLTKDLDDDKANKVIPIRLSSLSVGATHSSATMQNLTNVNASTSTRSPAYDVNYGSDVLWWGNNEFYQLGTGKRNNTNVPVYIQPLDPVSAETETRKKSGRDDEGWSAQLIGKDQTHRFQATPKKKVRGVEVEQRIVCGRGNSAVYSAV